MLSKAEIERLLTYDPETGIFLWKDRGTYDFSNSPSRSAAHICAIWNGNYAGKTAGSIRKDRYVLIRVAGKFQYAHRLAWVLMNGAGAPNDIDHINGNPSDNRWANLRAATRQQNLQNRSCGRKVRTRNLPKNVYFHKETGTFRAEIAIDGKRKSLGYFDCPAAASFAYQIAADKLHGEFARTA